MDKFSVGILAALVDWVSMVPSDSLVELLHVVT